MKDNKPLKDIAHLEYTKNRRSGVMFFTSDVFEWYV